LPADNHHRAHTRFHCRGALAKRMEALNQAIAEEQNLGPGFMIGHSYFCGNGAALTEKKYEQAVRHEILPLLREYWFGNPERVKEWTDKLGAKFERH
jgi:5-methylcytosine-specific restriction protein B